MKVWSSRMYRPLLSVVLVLVTLSPAFSPVNKASGTGIAIGNGPQGTYDTQTASPALVDGAVLADSPPSSIDPQVVSGLTATSVFSNSLALDGIGDYVNVPHDAAFDNLERFALEAWVLRSDDTRHETIISKGADTGFWLGFNGPAVRFQPVGSGRIFTGTTPVRTGVWTHISVVWIGMSADYVSIFINGEVDLQATMGTASGSGNTLPLYIGANPGPGGLLEFAGNIAGVRFWDLASTQRSQWMIRPVMHVALEEPLPGLVANWHLSDDYADNIGGHDGTPQGDASLDGPQAPPQPVRAPIDSGFNTLPTSIHYAATAYVPDLNHALLIGGMRGGVPSSQVSAVSGNTGNSTNLSDLSAPRILASAAYAPSVDTVYLFGGGESLVPPFTDAIYAIDPLSGTVRTVTAALPAATYAGAAVYHAGLDRIYIFGGPNSDVSVFDPSSETISSTNFTLPEGRFDTAAAYSAATDKIYYFGGGQQPFGNATTNTIYEMSLEADGLNGTVNELGIVLPANTYGLTAVEDPATHLIYLLGGKGFDRVITFDPVTTQLWQTPIEIEERTYAGAFYSLHNRHAVLMGGINAQLDSEDSVWRIPLGDGPAVPLGLWDFPDRVMYDEITSIDGDDKGVLVGTSGGGAWHYDERGTRLHYTQGTLGGNGIVHDVRYNAPNDHRWMATDNAGGKLAVDSTVTTYDSSVLGTDIVYAVDFRPGYTNVDIAPFFGTDLNGLKRKIYSSGSWVWTTNFAGESVRAITHRDPFDVWVVSNGWLKQLLYGGSPTETDYGDYQCGLNWPNDVVFGPNGDWWVVSQAHGESDKHGVCRILSADVPGAANYLTPNIGTLATGVDVDADGRVWISVESDFGQSGGLVVYETHETEGAPAALYKEEYNWLNAPVGSLSMESSTTWGYYNESNITAVGAVDERVWAGKQDGQLVTLAQRWQQLELSNDTWMKQIEGVWTVRGRLLLAAPNSLHVMQPDGTSWDNRSDVHVRAVLGDSQGRIWTGTDTGVRLYTLTGWDTLTETVGTPPTSTRALAEDHTGRIWIGGDDGLTLFDRDRFVFTLDSTNSDLPTDTVQALLVDRENRLWVGTPDGLARLDSDDSGWLVYTTTHGLPDSAIHDLAQLGDGRIAVSTASSLSLYDGSSFVTETLPIDPTGLPLSVDEMGRLWAGSAVLTADGWRGYYWTNSGLRDLTISDNAADGADRVWFGHAPNWGVSVRGSYLPPLATAVPTIVGISPDHGGSGDLVTISGSGFGSDPSDVVVTIGSAPAEIVSLTGGTTIIARLSDYNTSGEVSVSVGGERATLSFTGAQPPFCAEPEIDSISPTGGNTGVWVHIYGRNFDERAAFVSIGGVGPHDPLRSREDATHLSLVIQPQDGSGQVRVDNLCDGYYDVSTQELRHIQLSLDPEYVALNQGMPSYPLRDNKPTLVQHYVQSSAQPRTNDQLEIDTVVLTFTNPDTDESLSFDIPYSGSVPFYLGAAPPSGWLADTTTSLNVYTSLAVQSLLSDSGAELEMQTTLERRGFAVAQATHTIQVYPNRWIRVLLVPIMPSGYSASQLVDMQNNVNGGLDELRRRIIPIGGVIFEWSDAVLTKGHTFALDDWQELWGTGHDMASIRSPTNAKIAFGVVHESLVVGNPTGFAFWADVSQLANMLALDAVDALCEFVSGAVDFFCSLFGQDCGWECELNMPLYVGWARGDAGQVSALFGHETGHILGLVKPDAPNGSWTDNLSHSVNDELNGGECNDGGVTFNWNKSIYVQPGVSEPVFNPLAWQQIYPQNDPQVPDRQNVARAKTIMSYACTRNDDNVFFEPVDIPNISLDFGLADVALIFDDFMPGLSRISAAASSASVASNVETCQVLAPHAVPGERILVSGVITKSTDAGQIQAMKAMGEDVSPSPGFATGYWLVQFDGDDNELHRTGLYPLFNATEFDGSSIEHDVGLFAATLLRQEGLARIELRHDDVVLDTFSAGNAVPTVTITSPSGGVYSSGTIPVTWTASDADGDPLAATIEYSTTGAAAWTLVALSSGSGTVQMPVYQLAGSPAARFRVTASDGFNRGSDISAAFEVVAQPPRPYIGHPTPGHTSLEGKPVLLSGGADDNQDESLTGDGLRWSSDRDGDVGTGSELSAFLSVGQHTLTLEAENSVGLTATTSVTMTVIGDYDYDGIADSEELTDGLSPLTEKDAYSDSDGDGLPLVMERNRDLDPDDSDTDGDGRSDAEEIAAGTNPLEVDDPLPPDELEVFPKGLTFEADLSLGTSLPQQPLNVVSRDPVSWTLTADVTWLAASTITGTTPAAPTILLKAFDLQEGTHTGVLTFTSIALKSAVMVPVTATITNAAAYFDPNGDGCVNVGDVQDVAGRIPSQSGQEDFHYRRDVNRDGRINVADALLMAQRWATERSVCSAPGTATLSVVRVSAPISVSFGATFVTSIWVDNPQNLGGFEFDLAFDPAVLQVQEVTPGGLPSSTGRTAEELGPLMDNVSGTLAFGGYTYGTQPGVSGDGLLAQVTFRAIAYGDSTLDLQNPLLSDPAGNLAVASDQDAAVEVPLHKLYLPVVLSDFP